MRARTQNALELPGIDDDDAAATTTTTITTTTIITDHSRESCRLFSIVSRISRSSIVAIRVDLAIAYPPGAPARTELSL